jgi:ethanolamine utilization cobalamin adenosyltransferase
MVITESELREMWRDGKNVLPSFPPGTSFTPSALDFLKTHNLQVRFDQPAEPFSLPPPPADRPAWDKPGEFPVVLTGPVPVCSVCGQPVHHKPEAMTQLDPGHFALKTAPRIKLRGRLDTLHALVMLVAAEARRGLPHLASLLDSLAAYLREIQSAEYHGRPVSPLQLNGKTAEEIHAISHHPDQYLGIAHIVPGPEDLAILHWLNYLRATAREIEILALEVYPPPEREDLITALNRTSSAVYYLELLLRAGVIHWNSSPGASAPPG